MYEYRDMFLILFGGVILFTAGYYLRILAVDIILISLYAFLLLAGKFQYAEEEKIFKAQAAQVKNVKVEFCEWVEYPRIYELIKEMNVCFDLRQKTFIYRNSLPIKIFEYMASGKPVIYSDIKPIRKEMDVEKFGFLVDPENTNEIIKTVEKYINDPQLLKKHSYEARKAVEEKFNWAKLERRLLEYVNIFL